MDQGVIYVATGARFLEMAEVSCDSLKQHEPDTVVAIFTEPKLTEQVSSQFALVLCVDNPLFNTTDKIFGMQNTPFSKTIFLDCDTYIIRKFSDDIFKALEYYPLIARPGVSFNLPWETRDYVECINQLNTGVVAFDKKKTATFLSLWKSKRLADERSTDQPAFRAAILDSRTPYAPLAPAYNFMATNRCEIAIQKVKVVHFVNKKELMMNPEKREKVIARYRKVNGYSVIIKGYVIYDRDGLKILGLFGAAFEVYRELFNRKYVKYLKPMAYIKKTMSLIEKRFVKKDI